jgi:hypothetical protein
MPTFWIGLNLIGIPFMTSDIARTVRGHVAISSLDRCDPFRLHTPAV